MKLVSVAFIVSCLVGAPIGCGKRQTPKTPDDGPLWQGAAGLSQVHSISSDRPDEVSHQGSPRILPHGFRGSQACAECHVDKANSFFNTAHARSGRFIEASTVVDGRIWSDRSRLRRLHAELGEHGMIHEVQHLNADGSITTTQNAKIAFELGSGTHAHTYAFRDGDFWCESPLSWYAKGVGWDFSPGFDSRQEPEFDREITNRCVYCHVGGVEQWNHNPNRFEIREAAIGCERCHGGGHDHIQYHSADLEKRVTSIDPIVNPAGLPRSAAEAVCSQCHLQGDLLIVADGMDVWDFQPGQAIESNRTDIRLRDSGGNRIVGHTEQLRESDCYSQSERLTCVTCHDPHGADAPTNSDYYREACLECHGQDSCGLEADVRRQVNKNDCVSCHMPLQPTDVVHAALHQHRIGIHEESYPPGLPSDAQRTEYIAEAGQQKQQSPRNLYPIIEEGTMDGAEATMMASQRRLALAVYGAVFTGSVDESWKLDHVWARNQLIEQLKRNPSDRSARIALARDYLNHGKVHQAEMLVTDMASDMTREDRTGIQALAILSEIRLQQRNSVQAKGLFQRLTKMRRLSGDHFLHGLCSVNTGEEREAVRSFQQALRINPLLTAAHQRLAAIYAARGETDLAQSHQIAIRVNESE